MLFVCEPGRGNLGGCCLGPNETAGSVRLAIQLLPVAMPLDRLQERSRLAARRLETPTLYYGNLHWLRAPQVQHSVGGWQRLTCWTSLLADAAAYSAKHDEL